MADSHSHVYEPQAHQKISKSAAKYTDVAPEAYKDEPCRTCTYFQRIEPRHCSRVIGIILPGGHCKLWKAKSPST